MISDPDADDETVDWMHDFISYGPNVAKPSKSNEILKSVPEPMHGFTKNDDQVTDWWTLGQDELYNALNKKKTNAIAKNVILFVGKMCFAILKLVPLQ